MGNRNLSATISDDLWASIKKSYPLLNESARHIFESHVAVLRSMNAGDRARLSAAKAGDELDGIESKIKRLVDALSGMSALSYKSTTQPFDDNDLDFLQHIAGKYSIDDIAHIQKATGQGALYAFNTALLSLSSLSLLIQRGAMRVRSTQAPVRTHCLAENLYRFIEGIDRIISTQTGGLHIKRGNGVDNEEIPSWLLELCRLGHLGNEPLGASSVSMALKYVILHRRVREHGARAWRQKI